MGAGGDQQREDRQPEDRGAEGAGRQGRKSAGSEGRTRIGDAALTRALAAAKEGDEAAFAAVYQWVHPGLLGYVRGIVGDESEDVASEAWLQIARDLHRFTGDGGDFRRWAAVIARNRARDHVRRRLSRPRLSLTDGDALDVAAPRERGDAGKIAVRERVLRHHPGAADGEHIGERQIGGGLRGIRGEGDARQILAVVRHVGRQAARSERQNT